MRRLKIIRMRFHLCLVQGVLVGFGFGVVRSCAEDFHVGLGDAESFGSFGRKSTT